MTFGLTIRFNIIKWFDNIISNGIRVNKIICPKAFYPCVKFRSFYQEILDQAEANRQTDEYQKAMRKRGVWVEPLFGEAKQFHRLRRFRLRGLAKVNIEGVMTAAGQNLKRLIKFKNTEKKNIILN